MHVRRQHPVASELDEILAARHVLDAQREEGGAGRAAPLFLVCPDGDAHEPWGGHVHAPLLGASGNDQVAPVLVVGVCVPPPPAGFLARAREQ